jgi:hypothetical protein
MTHTVIADYKVARTELEDNPTWEIVADSDGDKEAILLKFEPPPDTVPSLAEASGTTAPARSRLGSLCAGVATWLKDCADNYAAATIYENLSRLSDTELKHRGLSRDLLSRDLNKRWA